MEDNKTPHLGLPLPDLANQQDEDVPRIAEALAGLDAHAAQGDARISLPSNSTMPNCHALFEVGWPLCPIPPRPSAIRIFFMRLACGRFILRRRSWHGFARKPAHVGA